MKPIKTVDKFDDTSLRKQIQKQDSISNYWQNKSLYWESIAYSYELQIDSLEALKPTIEKEYDEKIKFNNSATIIQLDSIIRSTWE